jgi:hypothetical protein
MKAKWDTSGVKNDVSGEGEYHFFLGGGKYNFQYNINIIMYIDPCILIWIGIRLYKRFTCSVLCYQAVVLA